ncbi:MAG: sigma 54-interacting transcriptional regulator [Polyangiales bacterium]
MTDDGKTVTALALKLKGPPTRTVEVQSPGTPPLLKVREGVVRIGRDANNEIVIDDPFVSRNHLEIRVFPHGVEVADLDTKNGTHFQGARIRELPIQTEATLVLGKNISVRVRVNDESKEKAEVDEFVGGSQAIQKLRSAVQRVAPTSLTVLIEGETGTGKEVVARAIHQRSPRAAKPLVVFDCASVSPTLIASELFGHTKGAYTGATGSSEGAFRRAHGGTLFLDEIGELPLDLQPALLRALEARQVRPVGGESYVPVDVRIIAATNRALEAEVEAGRFRKDLLFRLAVTRVKTPPLRSRPEDISILAKHFAAALGATLAPSVIAQLEGREWPGNVRELRNTVERAVMLAGGPGVLVSQLDYDEDEFDDVEDEPAEPTSTGMQAVPATIPPGGLSVAALASTELPFQDAKQLAVDAFEKEYLLKLFAESGYNLSEAARRSGVHRRYLRELYKKHSIDLASLRASRGK